MALAALTLLIFASGFIGTQSLRETIQSVNQLGEERLERLEEAQDLVRTALLIEYEAQEMRLSQSVQQMRDHYTRLLAHLERLDTLVSRLGQAGTNVSILPFQKAAQLFRGTVHILAKLHEQVLGRNGDGPAPALLANMDRFNRNLVQQGAEILVASQALSADFSAEYRQSVHGLMQQSERRRLQMLAMLGVGLLLSWLVSSLFLGKLVISRLRRVSHYLRRGADGPGEAPRVPVTGNDEIAEMARAVEQYMIEREQLAKLQRDATHTARFVAVGQLAAGIAHEINTPIQYIGHNLSFIDNVLTDIDRDDACTVWHDDVAEARTAIAESQEGVTRIGKIVSSMKEFSHPGPAVLAPANLKNALENSLTVSRGQWREVAEITCDFAPDLPDPVCDIGKINQVFLNLIINAAQAIEASGKPYPGTITLSTAVVDGQVEIRIADTGSGIPAGIRDRIFDPFFTTKPVGTGTGQGLAICRDIVVNKHGGSIDVTSTEGTGTEVVVRLPLTLPDA